MERWAFGGWLLTGLGEGGKGKGEEGKGSSRICAELTLLPRNHQEGGFLIVVPGIGFAISAHLVLERKFPL